MRLSKAVWLISLVVMCVWLVSGELLAQAEEGESARQRAPRPRSTREATALPLEELFEGRDVKLLGHGLLTDEYAYDDFPSLAVGSDGTAWVVYTAFVGDEDELRVRKYSGGRWNTFTRVPGVSGDVWMPKAVVTPDARLWVIWSQQVKGNWDVYARALEGKSWLKLHRLTDSPLPDINPSVFLDGQGRILVVWQGFRDGRSDIFLKILDSNRWSEEIQISDDPGNDWFPSVTEDSKGRIYVAWDSYRTGNYDVYLRTYFNGELSDVVQTTSEINYQVNASVACDKDDRVWLAWEYGDENWAKDQGYTVRARRVGSFIYGYRNIKVKVLSNGAEMQPVGEVMAALPLQERSMIQRPVLTAAPDGRVWMVFRHRWMGKPRLKKACWVEYVTWYKGDGWAEPAPLPESRGRLSGYSSIAPTPQGSLWAAWPTDNRQMRNFHQPVHDDIYAGTLQPVSALGEIRLEPYTKVEERDVRPGPIDEPGDVAAVRGYRARVDGEEYRIVRGDLHRHTEFSWDNGGRTDGSIIEFYRYMMDAAAMDFGAITDHNAGGDYKYWYWLTQKSSDLFNSSGGFVPLYGYERSAVYPWGHRNVFHVRRGVPVVSFFTYPDYSGARPGVGSGALMKNDSELLFEELEKTGGVAISHTSATNMGTDWSVYGGEVEPVVEIFQGCRISYEYEGAPRAAEGEGKSPGGYKPAGFVWNAWEKGYRLGVIASSDHVSTHISYAMVYAEDFSREGIIEGIRKRHTYGATDNILLDYRIGEHLMGEEFETSEQPVLKVEVRGTGPVSRVDVIKNNTFLHAVEPGRQEVAFSYMDVNAEPGTSYYYVRVQQEDGEMAWSSPIWVSYKP